MMTNPNRVIFYIVIGIIAALFAWLTGNSLIDAFEIINLPFTPPPYGVLLTVSVPTIAAAMVIAEIFLSSPTRTKANRRILFRYLLKAVLISGFVAGIVLSLLNWLLIESQFPSVIIRVISWSLIGLFAGIAEGLSWAAHSIEGTKNRIRQRLIQSIILGSGAGLVASLLFEGIRRALVPYDEPFGFLLLGALLGLSLCFAARPSYYAALRVGQGFEAIKPKTRVKGVSYFTEDIANEQLKVKQVQARRPVLNNQLLKFIPDDDGTYKYIEEGLSIQLPVSNKKPLRIGSSDEADIYIPHLPEECAVLRIRNGDVEIQCLCEGSVQIQRKWIPESRKAVLRHNQIVTLYYENDSDKFYRFVFYNRFLDPQA